MDSSRIDSSCAAYVTYCARMQTQKKHFYIKQWLFSIDIHLQYRLYSSSSSNQIFWIILVAYIDIY